MLCLAPPLAITGTGKRTTIRPRNAGLVRASVDKFPSFLPKEVEDIKDPFSRKLASRVERIPVQLWKSYIKKPIVLVGPSLGAAVAINMQSITPKLLILIDASVSTEGPGKMATLPRAIAYAGIGRLHCLFPWWEDATVSFMISGGYNVKAQVKEQLQSELPNAVLRQILESGHLPRVERPDSVAKLISEFVQEESKQEAAYVTQR